MQKLGFWSITGLVLLFLLALAFGFGNIDLINSRQSSYNISQNSNSNLSSTSNSPFQNNLENSSLNLNSKISLTLDKLEIAKTPQEQQKGMMFRDQMCENCGMIFEFENEDYRSFWMKNTLIDLDIIFIDKNGQIINIQNAKSEGKAEKNPKDYLNYQAYPSTDKAKYVLEVNSGFAQKMNLEAGKYLQIDKLLAQSVAFDNSYNEKLKLETGN